MVGELHQRADIRAQVRLAAHQEHLGVGAELLDLPFPLENCKLGTFRKPKEHGYHQP